MEDCSWNIPLLNAQTDLQPCLGTLNLASPHRTALPHTVMESTEEDGPVWWPRERAHAPGAPTPRIGPNGL